MQPGLRSENVGETEVVFLSDSTGYRFKKGVLILSDSSVGKNSERMQASGSSLSLVTNWFIVRSCEKRSRTTAAARLQSSGLDRRRPFSYLPAAVNLIRGSAYSTAFSSSPCSLMMETKPEPLKGSDVALFSLTAAIATLDLAKDTTGVKPAKDVFRSTSTLLAEIRVLFYHPIFVHC